MQPKKIRRVTNPLESLEESNSFVAIINGQPSFIQNGSGIDDEAMMTGQVDADALRESGMTDDEILEAQVDLEERILDVMIGDSAKAYTIRSRDDC